MSTSNGRCRPIVDTFRTAGGPFDGATGGARAPSHASVTGTPNNPACPHNFIANPDVTVEASGETFPAWSTVGSGAKRNCAWAGTAARVLRADHQCNAPWIIPSVALNGI